MRAEKPCAPREAMRTQRPCAHIEAMCLQNSHVRTERPCVQREAMRAQKVLDNLGAFAAGSVCKETSYMRDTEFNAAPPWPTTFAGSHGLGWLGTEHFALGAFLSALLAAPPLQAQGDAYGQTIEAHATQPGLPVTHSTLNQAHREAFIGQTILHSRSLMQSHRQNTGTDSIQYACRDCRRVPLRIHSTENLSLAQSSGKEAPSSSLAQVYLFTMTMPTSNLH
eukprot:1137333-Pelagomonas_calceolata.AAC.8